MKLLCLDSNSIINRAFYGVKILTTKDGTYTNAVVGFLNILLKLLADVQPDAVVCAFDLKAPTFRHKMFDGYKAQRKGMPEELAQQLPLVKQLLESMGYPIITREGYEADDILGTLSALCEQSGDQCFIATGDRDSLQLIGKNTVVLLASSRMDKNETLLCDEDYFFQKYGTTPQRLVDIKALMGDSSDNIPGVAGIGEKTALKLVGQYGDIDHIYADLDALEVSKSIRAKLEQGKESAYLSRTLATIDRSVPLGLSLADYLPKPRDEQALFQLLSQLEMNSMIKKLGLHGEYHPTQALDTSSPDLPALRFCAAPLPTLLDTLPQEATISLLPCFDNCHQMSALALAFEDRIALYRMPSEEETTKAQLLELLNRPNPKLTHDCKTLYHWTLPHGSSIACLRDDVMLSAYLLSANSSDYTLERLCEEYHLHCDITGLPEGMDEPEIALLHRCACIEPLHRVLREQIEQNNQLKLLEEIELPLSEVLAAMELCGFAVDTDALIDYGKMLDEQIQELEQRIHQLAGEEFNINSPKQLGEILFEKLGLPTRKKTKTGYSTSAEVLESLRGKHEIIDEILEYRKLAKLKSTYVDGLLKVVAEDGRIHTHFNQTDTRTGRLSSTEPNLQNIPVRTELGSRLRAFFKAQPDCELVDADYSQIELRVLAHISQDENMISAFNSDEDIHTNTAAQVFDMPPLFVTPEMRRKAKAVNFGIVYGIGAFSLSQDIGVSVAEADRYIKNYLDTFSGVRRYMEETVEFAQQHGYIETMFGRRRALPEIHSTNKNIVNFGKRVAMNTPIQGTAADIIKIAMIKVYRRLKAEQLSARLILQVHDELIVEAPLHELEQVKHLLVEEMQNAVQLSVLLKADVGCGTSWLVARKNTKTQKEGGKAQCAAFLLLG